MASFSRREIQFLSQSTPCALAVFGLVRRIFDKAQAMDLVQVLRNRETRVPGPHLDIFPGHRLCARTVARSATPAGTQHGRHEASPTAPAGMRVGVEHADPNGASRRRGRLQLMILGVQPRDRATPAYGAEVELIP